MSELFDYDINKNWLNEFRTTCLNVPEFVETRNDQFLRMLGMDVDKAIRKAIPESLYYWFDDVSFESVMSVDIYPHFNLCFRKLDFIVSYEENRHTIDTVFSGLEYWICDMAERAKRDIECKFKTVFNGIYGLSAIKEKEKIMPTTLISNNLTFTFEGMYLKPTLPEIKKVIFNDPATIILWKDGTKTVVKVKPGEKFDRWTGFAMACMKKLRGDDFHAFFRRWCEEK